MSSRQSFTNRNLISGEKIAFKITQSRPTLLNTNFILRNVDKLNFCLKKKRERNNRLIKQEKIVAWRRHYFKKIIDSRKQIVFVPSKRVSKTWQDTTIQSKSRGSWREFLLVYKNAIRRRETLNNNTRWNLRKISGRWLFNKIKNMVDYYKDMNGSVFEIRFKDILKNLPPDLVMMVDNVSYQSRPVEPLSIIK